MERTFYVLEKEGVKEQPSPDYVLCHVCEGRGILGYKIEDSFGEHNYKVDCEQCWSWGWVLRDSLDSQCPEHTYGELSQRDCIDQGITHLGMCYHVIKCEKCGRVRSYDTSD